MNILAKYLKKQNKTKTQFAFELSLLAGYAVHPSQVSRWTCDTACASTPGNSSRQLIERVTNGKVPVAAWGQ